MPSRSLSPSTRAPGRCYTALARAMALRQASRAGGQATAARPWELLKDRRGQDALEMHILAAGIGLFTLFAVLDLVVALIPFPPSGWHLLWIAPSGLVLWFVLLHLVGLACAFLGAAGAAVGFLARRRPSERTSFWFLLVLTLYAVHSVGSARWSAGVGIAWLALLILNAAAAIWCAMKSAEA